MDPENNGTVPKESVDEVQPAAAAADRRHKETVSFTIGDHALVIAADRIEEITHPLPVTPVPSLPSEVLGISAHRGSLVALVDSGIEPSTRSRTRSRPKWVILRTPAGNTRYAFRVDSLTDVDGPQHAAPEEKSTADGTPSAVPFDIDTILKRIESSLT